MVTKTLPGGAKQMEADKPKKRHHRKVKRVIVEKADNGGYNVRNEHDNPSGNYPPEHPDTTHVFAPDQFHSHVVPHVAKAMKARSADGAEPDADDMD